ncbi:MAG: uracil-DNA glycosylase [Sphingopyxis sp.]|nr:MAG: uracil-DNA glycosylase [Sphingopyxis sp.]
MTIAGFVDRLCSFESEHVFNPYKDICALHDKANAVEIRRKNILQMVTAAYETRATTIWVARDLGYRGGRRTGLALTDEAHLDHAAEMLATEGINRATEGPAVAERTATVIWDTLLRIQRPVMLWNVFPFHPHEAEDPMTNRCHNRHERDAALPFMFELIELLRPDRIVAIGRDAAMALVDIPLPVHQARHPSYGGQTTFVRQMEELYNLTRNPGQQHSLSFDQALPA